jgi:hypothetical protein
MTINEKFKKLVKWLLIIGSVVFAICDVWLRIMGGNWDYRGYDTSAVLGALLGSDLYDINAQNVLIPGFKELDILKWDKSEWNAPACYLPGKMGYESIIRQYNSLEFIYDRNSKTFFKAPLKKCLHIYGEPGWKLPYCNHWTRHDCINIKIRDFVLEKPDYLNKIIQILEQPCKYFPTDGKLLQVGLLGEHSAWPLMDARKTLGCDKKDKQPKRYILTLLDQRFNPRLDIIINRKE